MNAATAHTGHGRIKAKTVKSRVLDRDDELGFVVQCLVNSELSTADIAQAALKLGYSIAPATMERWIDGKVYRPQNYTINAAMAGMGWQKTWSQKRTKPHG